MVGASFTAAAVAQVLRSKKSVIAYNNAQVDTAQSYFGGASAYFDGTSDYLAVEHDPALKFGTGNFTIECWYRPIARTNNFAVLLSNTDNFVAGNIQISDRHNANSTKFSVYIYNNNSGDTSLVSTTSVANGTWYHLALVRNGTNIRLYVNGTSEASITVASDFVADNSANTTGYQIGAYADGDAATSINGHIDEVRVSNTARYTATFTPSTTPFVNDANTLLLIHANGTDASTFFEDDNGVRLQRGIEARAGTAVSTTQSKFGGSSMSFGTASGGNGKFALVNQSFSDFYFGGGNAGDKTYECWVYLTAYTPSGTNNTGEGAFPILTLSRGTDGYCKWCFGINEAGYLGVDYSASDGVFGGTTYYNNSTTLALNTWHHIAMVWQDSGNVIGLYANGTRLVNQAGATEPAWGGSFLPIGLTIGGFYWTPTGFIDEVRISNTARYTANFTPSTTPFVNDANTLLLLHMNQANAATIFQDDNTGTVTTEDSYTVPTAAFASDALTVALYHFENNGTDSGPNGYTLNTTGGYSSSVVKFGTYSGHLADSTSDYFGHTTDRQWNPYNGSVLTDWTVEGWFYYTSWTGASQDFNGTPLPNAIWIGDIGANRLPVLFGFTGAAHSPAGRLTMTAARVGGDPRGVVVTSTTTYNLNTWHHIALTYNSTTGIFKGYVNGEKAFTSSVPYGDLYTLPTHLTIGAGNGANSECYVDEVRISRMIRYGI
jgi:hypothetical protein